MRGGLSDREFWLGQDRRESLAWFTFAVAYGLLMGALHAPGTTQVASGLGLPAGFVVNPGFWGPLVLLPAIVATYRNDGVLVAYVLVWSPIAAMSVATALWSFNELSIITQIIGSLIVSLVVAGVAVICGSGARRFSDDFGNRT